MRIEPCRISASRPPFCRGIQTAGEARMPPPQDPRSRVLDADKRVVNRTVIVIVRCDVRPVATIQIVSRAVGGEKVIISVVAVHRVGTGPPDQVVATIKGDKY